ncbi:MAG TPA: queuosine salvage family protein, partial [Ktedonobacterales bacterium]|nr:queuosine salvage family protein [Ktedonobacterales bacterium]
MSYSSNLTIPSLASDPLGVLTTTAPVVRAARLVTLNTAAIEALAARWAEAPWPAEDPDFLSLHYHDGTSRTANWVLLLDALNFCFWADAGEPRWRIVWRDTTLDGYNALAAALTQAAATGYPLWDAHYLAQMDEATLHAILRPATGSAEIPLFAARLANAREVGAVLLARYDGQFVNAIAAANHDAVSLAALLARDFASFNDVAD